MIDILNGFGVNTQPQFWISVLQIVWINILLSGDNAVVIALACRSLPSKQRLAGMVLGTGMALVLRLIFASVVATLMFLPYIKIVGGLALLWIAVKLLMPTEESTDESAASDSLWRAVKLIAVADVIMSLDNVIAVAAAADGHFALLVFGLAISIPAIVAGANVIMVMLTYFPLIIWAGAAPAGMDCGRRHRHRYGRGQLRGVVRAGHSRKGQADLLDRRRRRRPWVPALSAAPASPATPKRRRAPLPPASAPAG